MFNQHLLESISRVLGLVAALPNLRTQQQSGDRSGPFSHWFDGGAYGVVAGYTVFEFDDGARALMAASSNQLFVDLPTGEHVSLSLSQNESEELPQAAPGAAASGAVAPSSNLPAALPVATPEPTAPDGVPPAPAPAADQLLPATAPLPIETIPPVTTRHCPHCGAVNKMAARFCRECGKILNGGASWCRPVRTAISPIARRPNSAQHAVPRWARARRKFCPRQFLPRRRHRRRGLCRQGKPCVLTAAKQWLPAPSSATTADSC
jgi:hypothetical protein